MRKYLLSVHAAYKALVIQLWLFVIGLTMLALALQAAFSRAALSLLVCFALAMGGCFVAMVILGRGAQKRLHAAGPATFPLTAQTAQDIVQRLDTTEWDADVYVRFCTKGRIQFRMLLLLYSAAFDLQREKARRKRVQHALNKQLHIAQERSFFDAVNLCRLDIQLCDAMSPELANWVCAGASRLLSRTEGIVRAAISLEPPMLRLPDGINTTDMLELRKYEQALTLLCVLTDPTAPATGRTTSSV